MAMRFINISKSAASGRAGSCEGIVLIPETLRCQLSSHWPKTGQAPIFIERSKPRSPFDKDHYENRGAPLLGGIPDPEFRESPCPSNDFSEDFLIESLFINVDVATG